MTQDASNFASPLHALICQGNGKNDYQILQYLSREDVDLEAGAQNFGTPLWWATKMALPKITVKLITMGADVNYATPGLKVSILHCAAKYCQPLIHRLVNCGANVNAKTKFGETPLYVLLLFSKGLTEKALFNYVYPIVTCKDFDPFQHFDQNNCNALMLAIHNGYLLTSLMLARVGTPIFGQTKGTIQGISSEVLCKANNVTIADGSFFKQLSDLHKEYQVNSEVGDKDRLRSLDAIAQLVTNDCPPMQPGRGSLPERKSVEAIKKLSGYFYGYESRKIKNSSLPPPVGDVQMPLYVVTPAAKPKAHPGEIELHPVVASQIYVPSPSLNSTSSVPTIGGGSRYSKTDLIVMLVFFLSQGSCCLIMTALAIVLLVILIIGFV